MVIKHMPEHLFFLFFLFLNKHCSVFNDPNQGGSDANDPAPLWYDERIGEASFQMERQLNFVFELALNYTINYRVRTFIQKTYGSPRNIIFIESRSYSIILFKIRTLYQII